MRKSYFQPSHNNQQGFSSEEQREGERSKLREKRNSGSGSDVAKKTEISEGKKLERKPTEDINASADAFIRNFRQQLHIQRLQSIENYNQMLARGL
ncbi:hypothetical protein VNO77_29387 [Canavalia gladiata]|uniref:Uncharacterized protein n=1 Tax=Canavalia gladiata TaxID=3824 RepID=A0AAN9KZU3_CANGL